MSDLVGKRLGQGNYEILSVLGQGGMATVYRAHQRSIDREVAIKIIAGQIATNPDFIVRFKREASMISKLEHPHILPVYDFGDEDGLVYLVMRLVDGGALDQRMRKQRLSSVQTAHIFTQIAAALTYSHQHGIIHRDLKPNNILLDRADNPYLMDFGIAKVLESDNANLTATGTVMGTPAYMAPEQWRAETLDARTDIYALGIMLYQMLTGKLPFVGDTPFALMYLHMEAEAPSPVTLNPQLPPDIKAVLDKALAKRKEDRYGSADEFAAAVNQCLLGVSSVPVPAIAPALDVNTVSDTLPGTELNRDMQARHDANSPRVLIAARSDETQPLSERLLTRLAKSFGVDNVASTLGTIDVEQTLLGHAPNAIRSYDAVLVVIGAGWLSATNGSDNTATEVNVTGNADQAARQITQAGERWLDDPYNPLRRSLEAALAAPKLSVILLLVDGAQAPAADALPPSLRGLASRETYTLSAGKVSNSAFEANFERDTKGLVKEIEERSGKIGERPAAFSGGARPDGTQSDAVPNVRRSRALLAVPVLLVALAAFGALSIASRSVTPAALPTVLPTVPATALAIAAVQPTEVFTFVPTALPSSAPSTPTMTIVSPTSTVPATIVSATVVSTTVVPLLNTPIVIAALASPTLAATNTPSSTSTLPPTVPPSTVPSSTIPPTTVPSPAAALQLTATLTASALPVTKAPTLLPAASLTVPPSATYNGSLLVIYRSADTLTFYVNSSTSVSLVGITIETDTAQGQHLKARLDQYPAFLGLPFGNMKSPVCFHLENKQRPESPPLQCRQIPSGKLFTELLSPTDLIWYDLAASEARTVNITRSGVSLGQCAGSAPECDLPLSTP